MALVISAYPACGSPPPSPGDRLPSLWRQCISPSQTTSQPPALRKMLHPGRRFRLRFGPFIARQIDD